MRLRQLATLVVVPLGLAAPVVAPSSTAAAGTPPWSIGATPSASSLSAAWCPSAMACITVGASGKGAPLAEYWNGTARSVLHIPPIVGQFPGGQLDAVSCSGPQACTAVGSRDSGQQTLAERWNGTAWKVEPTTNPPDIGGLLSSVAALGEFTLAERGG